MGHLSYVANFTVEDQGLAKQRATSASIAARSGDPAHRGEHIGGHPAVADLAEQAQALLVERPRCVTVPIGFEGEQAQVM
jgi:hypothetical protein